MTTIIMWIQQALLFGSFIMLAALGELLTEKAGNLNLGTPGTMCLGASIGVIGLEVYKNSGGKNALLIILIAIGASFAAGAVMGLIYSLFTTTLRTNQNVVGLVLTIFGVGMAQFLSIFFISVSGNVRYDDAYAVFNAKIPFLSSKLGFVSKILFDYGFMFYLTLILAVLMTLFLNRTRQGLSLRAVGENPATADAAGINVTKYKYLSTIIGSGITGVAGIYCVLEFKSGAWATSDITTIQAFGWLAVALVIFSVWKPMSLIWGSVLFGVFYWAYQHLPGLLGIKMSTDLLQMLPYLVTIVVLIIVSLRKSRENQGPAALGLSYYREDR